MSLSPRLIAIQGIGLAPVPMAVQGLIDFIENGGTTKYSGEVDISLSPKRKYYVRKNGKVLLFNSGEEADSFIEQDAKAEKIIKTKTSRLARKRVRDAAVAKFSPEVIDLQLTTLLSEKFDMPNFLEFVRLEKWDKVLAIQSLAIEMEEEEDSALLVALP